MGLFNFFQKKKAFTEEEMSILSQRSFSIDDSKTRAQIFTGAMETSKEIEIIKYENFYEVRQRTNTIIGVGYADISDYSTYYSSEYPSFEEALNSLK